MQPRPGQRLQPPKANAINRANALLDQLERTGPPPLPYAPGIMRVQNKSGDRVSKGSILGIKQDERLWDINDSEAQFLALPGIIGVQPRLRTPSAPAIEDHRIDWVIVLKDLEEDEIGPCLTAGETFLRVTAHDDEHMYVIPVDDDPTRGQTAAAGIARILYFADEYSEAPDPDPGRWARVLLDPAIPVIVEGYLTSDLDSPTADTTTTTIVTDAAISEDSQTVTSPSGGFDDDLDEPGVSIEITGAGPSGATISTSGTYIDANTITIDAVAETTVTGATVRRLRTQFSPTTATVRVHEKRGEQWFRTNHIVTVENVDHSLSLAAGYFVQLRPVLRGKWRVIWNSCNPAPGSVTSKSTALEAP